MSESPTNAEVHLAASRPTGSVTLLARTRRRIVGAYDRHYPIGRYQVHTDLYHPVALELLVSRLAPDALVCHVAGNNEHVRRAIALDHPTLFYVHGSRLGNVFDGVARMRSCRFAAESTFIGNLVQATTGLQVQTIRPILDPERFRISSSGNSVLVVNPHPLKGGHLVVELAASLPHRHFLVVGGWATTRTEPEALQIEMQLSRLRNVERIDHVEDMREVFRRSRCLLMPCVIAEAFGRAAAEALIAGIPVLASDRGALPETVGLGGIIAAADAPLSDWIGKLESLFGDEALYQRLRSGALAQAAENSRQPEYVVAALRRAIQSLLATEVIVNAHFDCVHAS